ncbi:hypothetical protein BsWGS_13364 [Bradybaena similaris]
MLHGDRYNHACSIDTRSATSVGKVCWTISVFLILTKYHVESKNVVFLPVATTSHVRLHAIVAEELAKMGHNVWVGFSSNLLIRNESYQGVKAFSYNDFWDITEESVSADLEATVSRAIITGTDPDWSWLMGLPDTIAGLYYEGMVKGHFTKYIESLHPDLLVFDGYPNVEERVAIAYKLKIPFAFVTTLYDPVTWKVPFNPVAVAYNSPYIRSKANLFEKVMAVLQIMAPMFLHIFNDRGYMKQLFPTDPNVPASNELMSQAEVYIIQSDPINDYPVPTMPNMKLIGGVSVSPSKPLREPFKSFVEKSEKAGVGVAVLSFGSLVMNLPEIAERKIISALRRLKINTIWRSNITSPDPDQILTSTWLPVNDLLGHENVKVFISHVGANSLYEALYHAVPTVCVPLFYDQYINAERAQDKGYCINLDIVKVTADELFTAIETVVYSKEMRTKISTASEIYRLLYSNSRQEGAFWLDHVLRYGGSYMRYSGQKLPMTLFVMDYILVFFVGAGTTLSMLLIAYVSKLICHIIFRTQHHLKYD